MGTNRLKIGVVSKGGEFFKVETEEERAYLEELIENYMIDLEWEMWARQNGRYNEDDYDEDDEDDMDC